jgi:hypothetical protein
MRSHIQVWWWPVNRPKLITLEIYVLYDGILNKYIYWSEHDGNVTPKDYARGRYSSFVQYTPGLVPEPTLPLFEWIERFFPLALKLTVHVSPAGVNVCIFKLWHLLRTHTFRQVSLGIVFCSCIGYQLAICQQYVTQEKNNCRPVTN